MKLVNYNPEQAIADGIWYGSGASQKLGQRIKDLNPFDSPQTDAIIDMTVTPETYQKTEALRLLNQHLGK